jgi:hypothetical protein
MAMKKYKFYVLIVATLFILFIGFKIFKFFQIDDYLDGGENRIMKRTSVNIK